MSDQSSKCLQIVLNVDAKVKDGRSPRRQKRPWLIFNVGLKIGTLGLPTEDFELVDIDGVGLVTSGHGPAQAINLSLLHDSPRVVVNFNVLSPTDLHFPDNVFKAIGVQHEDEGCPLEPVNGRKPQFVRKGLSANKKLVSLQDRNDDGQTYRFALFVYRGKQLVAVCDPRIINK